MVAAAVAWIRAARPDLTPDQVAQVVRAARATSCGPGWESATGFGLLSLPGARRAGRRRDPLEPNDDVRFVDGRAFGKAATPLFRKTAAPRARSAGPTSDRGPDRRLPDRCPPVRACT